MAEEKLSRRERQILDAVYAHGEATANQVLSSISEAPSRTAVRTFLRILVDKGHLTQRLEGRAMVYKPVRPRKQAGQSAMKRGVDTFFGGSLRNAFAAHLADSDVDLSEEELKKLAAMIREARQAGR